MEALSLVNIPLEDLYNVMIRIPYEHLQSLCQTSPLTQQVCSDPKFWAQKAQNDLQVSTQEFYQVQATNPRQRYLQLAQEFRNRLVIIQFLREIFNLGMYIRGWKGPGNPYPTSGGIFCDPNAYSPVAITMSNVYKLYTQAPQNVKSLIHRLPIVNYNPIIGYDVTDRSLIQLFNSLSSIDSGQYCARLATNPFILSAVYHLQNIFGINIPSFNIDMFRYIQ